MKVARRAKAKTKKTVSKRTLLKDKKPKSSRIRAARASKSEKEVFRFTQLAVGAAKFSNPEINNFAPKVFPKDLPSRYDHDKMILMVRDPWWLYTYWEVKDTTWQKFKNELKEEFYKAKHVLRVYDVTNIIFNGSNANRFFDIQIHEFARNWYIDVAGPGRSWCVDLGLKLPNGRFITILRSNVVLTPLDGPSWETDEEWMIPDDMFARLYGMGFGFGKSSPVGKLWRERIISSGGVASMASPVRKPKERSFWLKVDCELIVYGATESNAKVTVQGRPIKLRPDGTFTLRFAFPDGKQVIPVKAVSADNEEARVITPIATRETK